ncbi:thioredoxin family protein [Sulfurivermis fontis]|uniref:thioredoxin family protein n=1 Tax=Sulfurivermis fontis TaxID=1972068 RepID=UPI0015599732|nr:thioredoxin family protein [Sulfurivermis fontis]
MPTILESTAQFTDFLQQNPAAVVYFSRPDCAVCQVLKPRILALLRQEFPRIAVAVVDCAAAPELAAQQAVFTVPVVAVYIDGRESLRLARNFTPGQLAAALERPYALFFD